MSHAASVALLSNDLMMTSTVSGVAAQHELPFRTITAAAQLGECHDDDLILIDLATPGLDLNAAGTALNDHQKKSAIVYGPHVHVDRFEQAHTAGFQQVLARGAFSANVAQLIGQFATSAT